MPIEIQRLTISLKTDRPLKGGPTELRGYIGNQFRNEFILHHHQKDGKFIYSYPRIQYKFHRRIPVIVAINEGIPAAQQVYLQLNQLELRERSYMIYERETSLKRVKYGTATQQHEYQFQAPWLALNQKNHKLYRQLDSEDKNDLLTRILVGNIISMSKSLRYEVRKRITIRLCVKEFTVNFEGMSVIGFIGTFVGNFLIPNYLGIGKAVSRGWGWVIEKKQGKEL